MRIFAHRYTGKERDAESGLDYFGARYYTSSMGRFSSPDNSDDPDPVPFADLSNPQSLNLYGYVQNNPLSNTDPDGHEKCADGTEADACVTTTAPDPVGLQFGVNLLNIANQTVQAVSNAARQFMNVMNTPGGPGCLGNAMLAGGMVGASTGGSAGLVGVAAGGVGEVVTSPGGALLGSGVGAAGAGMAAMSACGGGGSGSGSEGGGESGGSDSSKPPVKATKLRGNQGWRDENGNIWKKDMLHKDHWDVSDRVGNKIKEVTFDGRELWPNGPKNAR